MPRAPRPLAAAFPFLCALVAACFPGGPPPAVPSGHRLGPGAPSVARPAGPAGPVVVVFAAPRGETRADSEISVVFDRPMRPLGLGPADPPPPITLRPAVKGAFHWLGSAGLRFDAEEALAPATAYRVEVPAGTRALDGTALAASFVLTLATPRPALVESDPSAGATEVAPDASLALTFNQPIADAEILRAVSMSTERPQGTLSFTVEREALGTRFGLVPSLPLPVDSRIHVRVDATLRGERGELAADLDRELVFTTVSPPSVRRIACTPHPDDPALCDPDDDITIELTRGIPSRAFARAVVIDPPATWDSAPFDHDYPTDTLVLRPEVKPRTRYRVRLDPARAGVSLDDALGQHFAAVAPTELRFGGRRAEAQLGITGTYWSRRTRHDVPVFLTNVAHLEISATPTPLEQVLAELTGAPAPAVHGGTVLPVSGGALDERVQRSVALDDLLAAGARGAVRLVATTQGAEPQERTLQLTDLAISARVGHGSAAVLVSGLDDGRPVSGAAVEVFRLPRAEPGGVAPAARAGAASTGLDGSVSVPLAATFGDAGRVVVAARSGADWAYATLRAPEPAAPVGVVYTERGLYRPGESVKLAGFFRVPGPSGLETPPAGTPVQVEVREGSGAPLLTAAATLSEFGTFAADLPIPRGAPLGRYRARVHALGGAASTGLGIAEYRPTSIEVEAATDRAEYVRGDDLTCTATSRYLHGGAIAGAEAALVVRRRRDWFMPPGLRGFTVRDLDGRDPPADLARATRSLDARGEASVRASLALPAMTGTESVSCAVEVMDLDRQARGASASATVHPGEVYVALEGEAWDPVGPGETSSMRALAVSPAGERRVASVHLEAASRDPATREEHLLMACDVTTGAHPEGCSWTVPPSSHPNTEIVVSGSTVDRRGNRVRASYALRVQVAPKPERVPPSEPQGPPPSKPEPLWVSTSPRNYTLGETGHIDIQSPLPGPATALVTIEREGILWQRVVPVPGASASVDFPITHRMIPGASVEVTLIALGAPAPSPVSGRPPGRAAEHASASFTVDPAPQKLSLVLDTRGERHRPGEEIDVEVEVADAAGNPAHADVTLYAADEGSLSLAYYQMPDAHRRLFYGRPELTRGFEARDDRVWTGYLGYHPRKPTSVRMGASRAGLDEPRSDFRQTVVFAPHLITDSAGRVRRRVKLPDGLTAYRFMAVAVAADDRAGSAEAKVTTSTPLMARASLPRVLRAGDRFEASVVVSTRDVPAGDVEVRAEASGVALEGPRSRILHVEPGVPAEVRFAVRADHVGPARLTVRATLGRERDAVTLAKEVVAPLVPESAAIDGETRGAVAEQLADLGRLRPDYGGLALTLSNGPLAGLADGIQQLLEYPYGCTEQTASRLVPLLALRDLARALGVDLPADVDVAIGSSVARMLANQRPDGGFGLWPESSRSEPWVSAWALRALGEARRRGVALPEGAEARARGYLGGVSRVTADATPAVLSLAALLADLAAEDGHVDRPLLQSLVAARGTLPPSAQGLLLHALAISEQDPAAQRDLERALEALVRLDGDSARAVAGGPRIGVFDSDAQTTAMILRALVASAPGHPLVSRLARGLLGFRRDGRFRNTHDAAWALLALDAVRRAHPPDRGAVDARVFLGARRLAEAHLDTAGPSRSFVVPMAELARDGTLPLTFAVSGAGTLQYQARLHFARAELPAAPVESGIFLRRTARPLGPARRAAGAFVAGETVQVVLDLVTPSPRRFVAIESPLPGGFEAFDAELGTGGSWLRDLEQSGSARRELRDDRVVYFIDDLPAGITTLRYVVRAATPGVFVTPPARAEEMYAPETFGRTAAEATVVTAP